MESMARSAELTRACRWQMLEILAIAFLLFGAAAGVGLLLNWIGILAVSAIGSLTVSGVLAGYWCCLYLITCHELRCVREGNTSREVVAVFE